MSKSKKIAGNLTSNYWVQKSDPLLLMRTVPFTLGELKILDTYISRINASDASRRTVVFTKEEYEELMGITYANYRALQKHTKGLLGKVVELQMPDKTYLQFVLFSKAFYHKNEFGKPVVEITCTEEAKDLFFCIDKYHFFEYVLDNVIGLSRKASYLLYLYIKYNSYRKKWEVDLDELRDNVFDCKNQESYKAFKEFKRAILDPAVKEINQKTDCSFDYETIKFGRKVVKIKFIVHSAGVKHKLPLLKQLGEQQDDIQEDIGEVDYGGELADLLGDAACDNEFTPEQIRVIQDLVIKAVPKGDNIERCDYLIHQYNKLNMYDKNKKTIKSRFNYLCKIIEKDTKDSETDY